MKHFTDRVRGFSINYNDRPGRPRRLLDRGFWLHLPRVPLVCRLRGHRPVVDGYDSPGPYRAGQSRGARWVCCDRCGLRPQPQTPPGMDFLPLGTPYRGELPPWRADAENVLGGQLVLGRTSLDLGANLTVGAAGSEHPVSGHVTIPGLVSLHLHTEGWGTWLQRRLVPKGHTSRVLSFSVGGRGQVRWEVWGRDGEWRKSDPWWMSGSVNLNLFDRLLGPRRYSYEKHGEPVTETVRMADGDSYEVSLQLKRETFARQRLTRPERSWVADMTYLPGIDTRGDDWKGGTTGLGVTIPDTAVENGSWPRLAAALVAARLQGDRARYGFRPRVEPTA